jgi:hypothetical protein
MTMRDQTFRAPLQLAVASGATTPNPGQDGVIIWSTTTSSHLIWHGTAWAALSGGGGGGTPAGATGVVQYNNGGAFGGAANVKIDNGDLTLAANAAPVTPAAGNVKMFGRSMASRVIPAAVGPSGMDYAVQPSMWRQKVGRWNPPGNATTVPGVDGFTAWTAVGTATARTVATTNLLTRMRRLGYVSAATAAALVSLRTAAAQFTTGNGGAGSAALGGFFTSFRFGVTDAAAVTGARMFVGMSSNTAAPTNVEPSTLLNQFGIAQLSTDATQLYFVYGGSAAQAAIPLGTGFPPANNAVAYDLTLWCPPTSNGVVNYELFRLDTGTSISGTITPATPGTQTPLNTTLLNHVMWRTNNATALAVALDVTGIYVESDY